MLNLKTKFDIKIDDSNDRVYFILNLFKLKTLIFRKEVK